MSAYNRQCHCDATNSTTTYRQCMTDRLAPDARPHTHCTDRQTGETDRQTGRRRPKNGTPRRCSKKPTPRTSMALSLSGSKRTPPVNQT